MRKKVSKIIILVDVHALVFSSHHTLLPIEAMVVEGDVWAVTTCHILLHRPDDSVETPVATLWFIHTMVAKQIWWTISHIYSALRDPDMRLEKVKWIPKVTMKYGRSIFVQTDGFAIEYEATIGDSIGYSSNNSSKRRRTALNKYGSRL